MSMEDLSSFDPQLADRLTRLPADYLPLVRHLSPPPPLYLHVMPALPSLSPCNIFSPPLSLHVTSPPPFCWCALVGRGST